MAISAILVAGVYYSFYFFNRQYYHFRQALQEREKAYTFEQQLRNDFSAADYVQDKGQRLHMVFPAKEVVYYFHRDFVLREQVGRQDTLYSGLRHYRLEEVETVRKDVLVRSLEVDLADAKGDLLRLLLYRSYSSEILVNGIQEQVWQE